MLIVQSRKQRSTEMRTSRNKSRIQAMNGLENHHYTMQNTLIEGHFKDKFEHGKYKRCTRMHNKGVLWNIESQREPGSPTLRRECQCSTYTETPTQQSAVSNNRRPTPRTRVGALSRCHPGHRDTPVGPGRTPTVHRCPKGEAVGGPSTNSTQLTLFVDPQSLSGLNVNMVAELKVRSAARTQPERRTVTSSRVASQMRE